MANKKAEIGLTIEPLKQGRVKLKMIGTTPLYFNSMSAKTKRTLLIGGAKKSAAEKKLIKHNPEKEFRDSAYKKRDGDTLLCFPAPGVKGTMATAALETPGVTKTSVQRLIFLPENKIQVWGKPYMKMDIVRSADMNKTPDIRTRAFLPQWCAEFDIAYVDPTLNVRSIVALLANAGVIVGIGDFRQEKGRGSFGTFAVAGDNLGEWSDLWEEITQQGRDVQERAMADAEPYDDDTLELLDMVIEEREERGLELVG